MVRHFDGEVHGWMNLKTAYEIKMAEKLLAKRVFADIQPMTAWLANNFPVFCLLKLRDE